jgi:hypothetical protein
MNQNRVWSVNKPALNFVLPVFCIFYAGLASGNSDFSYLISDSRNSQPALQSVSGLIFAFKCHMVMIQPVYAPHKDTQVYHAETYQRYRFTGDTAIEDQDQAGQSAGERLSDHNHTTNMKEDTWERY